MAPSVNEATNAIAIEKGLSDMAQLPMNPPRRLLRALGEVGRLAEHKVTVAKLTLCYPAWTRAVSGDRPGRPHVTGSR